MEDEMSLLRDKTVLLLGNDSTGHTVKCTRTFPVKVVLVFGHIKEEIRDHVHHFIQLDISDHTKDDEHVTTIIRELKARSITLDGCLTFSDEQCPLAAAISSKLNLHGVGLAGAKTSKSKYDTHRIIYDDTEGSLPAPKQKGTRSYAAKSAIIRCVEDIQTAINFTGLPSVLKTEFGCGGLCVTKVSSFEDCLAEFLRLQNIYNSNLRLQCYNQHGFGRPYSLVLVEYLDGSEFDVNIVMFEGQLLSSFVFDNGLTRPGSFLETSACMPTRLPSHEKESLISAAYECCTKIGLRNGVFNVEMKMVDGKPRLIEINPRMPGFVSRDWVKDLYGVDLMTCSLLICCGIKPNIPSNITPAGQLVGVMCVASLHRHLVSDPEIQTILSDLINRKLIKYVCISPPLDGDNKDLEKQFCNVAVMDEGLKSAKTKLIQICEKLKISSPEYPVEDFLSLF